MPIEVRGHLIHSTFTFVCDGKLYRSSNAKGWVNIQDQFGYSVFGRYQHAWRVRNVDCTANRDRELTSGFRNALTRQTGARSHELDAYIAQQIAKGNQVLVEGSSVKVYNGNTTVTVKGFSNGLVTKAAPAVPESKIKDKSLFAAYVKHGVPADKIDEFHTWYSKNSGAFSGVKLKAVIKAWKAGENPAVAVAAPVAAPLPKVKKQKAPLANTPVGKGYLLRGVPEERLQEFHEWVTQRAQQFHGVKMDAVVAAWKEAVGLDKAPALPVHYDIPVPQLALPAPTPESLAADKVRREQEAKSAKASRKYRERKQRERKKRELADEREHEEDVPFYGRRRRNQAAFHNDVAQNCGCRCVYTLASEIRCDAAHLVPHARKGGASFKNGILLRKDLHVLMDANQCAIDPQDLTLWFTADILASDGDLAQLNGRPMRPTDKPIKRDNLATRWDAFLEVYMG